LSTKAKMIPVVIPISRAIKNMIRRFMEAFYYIYIFYLPNYGL